MSDTPLTDAAINATNGERGVYDELDRFTELARTLERANAALKEQVAELKSSEVIARMELDQAREDRDALLKDNAALRAEVEELRNVLGQTRYAATQAMDEVRAVVGAPCGADDKSSNRAVDYVRAEVERLKADRANLDGLLVLARAGREEQKQRAERAEAALAPFAHDDLCEELGGNIQGDESPVYARNRAVLKLGDFRAARAATGGTNP